MFMLYLGNFESSDNLVVYTCSALFSEDKPIIVKCYQLHMITLNWQHLALIPL